jgi:hypothetical protein
MSKGYLAFIVLRSVVIVNGKRAAVAEAEFLVNSALEALSGRTIEPMSYRGFLPLSYLKTVPVYVLERVPQQ